MEKKWGRSSEKENRLREFDAAAALEKTGRRTGIGRKPYWVPDRGIPRRLGKEAK